MTPRLVAIALVRDEDLHLEQALRNVAGACDRIHVLDHLSRDGTPDVLHRLAIELDHLDVHRSADAGDSHRLVQPYAGTPTWVLGVDGDELYDPEALLRLREALLEGAFDSTFRVKGHVLNCDALDSAGGRASGWAAPPSRPVTKLFNFAAIEAWPDCPERLEGVRPRFRAGYDWETRTMLADTTTWETDPLRMLHLCFVPRSSLDADGSPRANLRQARAGSRAALTLRRLARRPAADTWKQDKYRRGPRVEVDARPFLRVPGAQASA